MLRRRVRVWYGGSTLADYIAAPEMAARYEEAMRRRFPSARVTNDPFPPVPDPNSRRRLP